MKDTRPVVQQWEDVCESVFMGGRYTEYNLWTDKIATASANVIKTIKWEKAAGIRWFFNGTTAFFFARLCTSCMQDLFVREHFPITVLDLSTNANLYCR